MKRSYEQCFSSSSALQFSGLSKRRVVGFSKEQELSGKQENFEKESPMSQLTCNTCPDNNLQGRDPFYQNLNHNKAASFPERRIVSSRKLAFIDSFPQTPLSNTILSAITYTDTQLTSKERESPKNIQFSSQESVILECDGEILDLLCSSQVDHLDYAIKEEGQRQKLNLFNISGQSSQKSNLMTGLQNRKDTLEADEEIDLGLLADIYDIKVQPQNNYMSREDSSFSHIETNPIKILIQDHMKNKLSETIINEYLEKHINLNQEMDKSILISSGTFDVISTNKAFLNIKERISISDWMSQYCSKNRLQRSTFHLALSYFDKAIDQLTLNEEKQKSQQRLEGIAATCLYISSKMEEMKPPRLVDLLQCVYNTNNMKQLLMLEKEVCQLLTWQLNLNTPFYWLQLILVQWAKLMESEDFQSVEDDLECNENILDSLAINKLFYILEVLRMDLKTSLYQPLYFALSLFYIFHLNLSGPQFSSQKSSLSDNTSVFKVRFNILLQKMMPVKDDEESEKLLEPSLIYIEKFSEIISQLIRNQSEKLAHDDEDQQVVFYNKYLRPEITSVILNGH